MGDSEIATHDVSIVCRPDFFADPLIATIRKFAARRDDRVAARIGGVIKEQTLDSAIAEVCRDLDRKILVTIGFSNSELSDVLDFREASRLEAIVCRSGDDELPPSRPSSSPFDLTRAEARGDPVPFVRKAVVRQSFRMRATVVPLTEDGELKEYFALRYRVWKEMNYLAAPGQDCAKSQLELNYTDRFSYPIGVFSRPGGAAGEKTTMLGCGRLVRGDGQENGSLLRSIDRIVAGANDTCLSANFAWPEKAVHPFDLLDSFKTFEDYYRELRAAKPTPISKAELSRIIVDPSARQGGVGEVIVDSLVSEAERMGIERLFLACVRDRAPFYARAGFALISGLTCQEFSGVGVPAVAMDLHLGR
jgi:GNAT superfamily N-acetyltransferase